MFTRLVTGIREQQLLAATPRGSLYVMHYEREAGGSRGPLVLVAPDGEERAWAQRSLVTAARVLAQAGCQVFRFDHLGQGESDGEYEDTTLATRVADLQQVVALVRERTQRVPVVVGLRLGATVAILGADRLEAAGLALWEPVLDPAQYLRQLLRVNVSTQMVAFGEVRRERDGLIEDARAGGLVSVNGYNLTGAFIDELLSADAREALARYRGGVLMLSESALDPRASQLPGVTSARVPVAGCWKEPKLHSNQPLAFVTPTLDWLASEVGLRDAS